MGRTIGAGSVSGASTATTPPRARPISPDSPMPFGKHKGIPIRDAPPDYLAWCLASAPKGMDVCKPDHPSYWPELRAALETVLRGTPVQAPPPRPPRAEPEGPSLGAVLSRLAAGGYRVERIPGRGHRITPTPPPDLDRAATVHRAALLAALDLCGAPEPEAPTDRLRARVKSWYRALSVRFHPDRGGSTAQQAVVNEAYKSLLTILDELEGT